jgi:hypothetical protein
MLNEEQIDTLMGIFYAEAPYDYVIAFDPSKPKLYKGLCDYTTKVCLVLTKQNYFEALETLLHEIAHARIQHRTHSDVWEKELVRLLDKYKFPRHLAGKNTIVGPNVQKYIQGV